ncbi:MAG: bifunctional 2-polyprenyl-6-hydroxyphenol methylase/3-demethylubiquinol 3-O-methyltransferase UbiG [Hyphomicrobiales bacterium]|nr:bifunctional 2-polyprenyl-6-hydroxyphenol methylase/3-demethylubiquinol 3-O-methyltransferase UbiG [Hyphomicrobiales bacterium]
MRAPSIDPTEVERFDRLASTWWDQEGPMRALHAMNPVRLSWIRREASSHFGLDPSARRLFAGQTVLDIGCGGGILCEPLARLGAKVTGIDPASENIEVAKAHYAKAYYAKAHGAHSGLAIDYRNATVEDLAEKNESFDIALAMEVVEHVADISAFMAACERVLKPGGILLMSTLNRTLRSFALAIVGAEYVLGWLPRGTHDWEKFLTPDELASKARRAGLAPGKAEGLFFDPLRWQWRLSRDTAVNYVLSARKPASAKAQPVRTIDAEDKYGDGDNGKE